MADDQSLECVGDGVTDNACWFETELAKRAGSAPAGLRLPAGIYAVSRTIELPTAVSLQLDPGACLRALPGFQGDAVIRKERCRTHAWSGRIAGGMIDGGRQNLIGIHVPGACRMDIHDIEIVDCLNKGIYIGLPAAEKTWGYLEKR